MRGNHYSNGRSHRDRSYHAPYISDNRSADDDICVWADRATPSDSYDKDEEPLANHFRGLGIQPAMQYSDDDFRGASNPKPAGRTKTTPTSSQHSSNGRRAKQSQHTSTPPSSTAASSSMSHEATIAAKFRENQVQYALSEARRNLTRMSQFMLKLEARAGKTTKEGIRQTLDATVRDLHYDFNTCGTDENGHPEPDHKSEIDEINQLSRELYERLFLVDRHWRRSARDDPARSRYDGAGSNDYEEFYEEERRRRSSPRTGKIEILNEDSIRDWIRVEEQSCHLSTSDACFYTIRDLAAGRDLRSWAAVLRGTGTYQDHPNDNMTLVGLAWRFLDRRLRGPRPLNPATTLDQFVAELEKRKRDGKWAGITVEPDVQVDEDREAWGALRKYWSTRAVPA